LRDDLLGSIGIGLVIYKSGRIGSIHWFDDVAERLGRRLGVDGRRGRRDEINGGGGGSRWVGSLAPLERC
jgi:hypothetical protein